MSSQKLKMTYHPAKKEVLFERFGAEGTPVTIRSDSKLYKYMNKKGQFILQDHGDAFFEDIAKAFDGESSVDMEVVTTKSDFGDFEQMVEYYNEGHSVKINATLLAELPDMNTTYTKVKEHGEKAIAILKKHREDFHTIQTDTPAVKESIDSFSQEVYKASALIREKIDCMGDNNINLCFAGVYSTGKSTLINAILGYRILPEAIHSETARMFEIKSPQKGEPVKIIFEIEGFFSELIWNEKTNVFEFGAAPTENMVREDIQKVINSVSHELQHVQVFEILKKLNCLKDVGSVIKIRFPIPLDTPSIQFTIYDTPGADSNYLEHQEVLKDALAEQTHSISETYKRYEIKDGKLPDEVIKVLHLDADYLYQNINQPTMSFIEKLLKGWFFGLGKVKAKESHKADVKQKIKTILSDYTREFLKTRQTVLEKVRDSFIEEIQTVIRNNGNISEQAKAYVCEIIPPEVKKATNLVEFGDIYDSNRRTENVLFWERTTVDKESFKEDVTSELATITGKMASDFTEDYKKAVSTLLNQVQAEFVLNMDNYSILMKAKLSDKKAMEELHKKIVSAEEALLLCQQDLNSTIWSVNNNG